MYKRQVEGQLNQLKMSMLLSQQGAKEAEDKKNEVVMYLAHDIRTPLTTVIGYLSLLDEAPDLPPAQRAKYIGVALDKAERLEALINELFEITRYHSHIVTLHRQLVDLSALLSQVLDDFYPVLSAKGNTAQLAVHDELTISADPEKLARVFGNLLKNAAAYSYPRTAIHITVLRSGDCAQIAFTNCGPTIAAEDLTAIFDKFSRLDQARLSDTCLLYTSPASPLPAKARGQGAARPLPALLPGRNHQRHCRRKRHIPTSRQSAQMPRPPEHVQGNAGRLNFAISQ